MFLFLKWRGGKRTVVNDIFTLSLSKGFAIMNNDELWMTLGDSTMRNLTDDEIVCGICTTGIYYMFFTEETSKQDLKVIEPDIWALLIGANAKNITIDILHTLPC